MSQTPDDAVLKAAAPKGGAPRPRITAQQVIEYLRRHPDFLLRHAALLDTQVAPARQLGVEQGDRVLDLQHFMVERLRRDLARLRADQDDLLANSRDNLSTQERVHGAVLALLAAESFEALIEAISTDLAVWLDVDVATLCVEAADDTIPRARIEGVQILAPGTIADIMAPGREIVLRDDVAGDPEVFGAAAALVRSDALIRLGFGEEKPIGLLAFGTRHPGYFNPGQGTELLGFLARILEHCVRTWLKDAG
jgi:uncharacterized protein YigA (DUF484 family)